MSELFPDSQTAAAAPDRDTARRETRRAFFTAALGAAAAGAGALAFSAVAEAQTVTDVDQLNFLLNLGYLQANYYSFATTGIAIAAGFTTGPTAAGTATGGRKVTFTDTQVSRLAVELAAEDLAQVATLRAVVGVSAVSQPAIDLSATATSAFSRIAQDAGIVAPGAVFDPYASDENFLLGAFLFEDVVASAYTGAAPLLTNLFFLDFAAALLGTKGYHAATVRSTLYRKGLAVPALIDQTEALSRTRDALSGTADRDQGVATVDRGRGTESNVVPTATDGTVFARSAAETLNIAYLSRAAVATGGFFPAGVNGAITTSAAN